MPLRNCPKPARNLASVSQKACVFKCFGEAKPSKPYFPLKEEERGKGTGEAGERRGDSMETWVSLVSWFRHLLSCGTTKTYAKPPLGFAPHVPGFGLPTRQRVKLKETTP